MLSARQTEGWPLNQARDADRRGRDARLEGTPGTRIGGPFAVRGAGTPRAPACTISPSTLARPLRLLMRTCSSCCRIFCSVPPFPWVTGEVLILNILPPPPLGRLSSVVKFRTPLFSSRGQCKCKHEPLIFDHVRTMTVCT